MHVFARWGTLVLLLGLSCSTPESAPTVQNFVLMLSANGGTGDSGTVVPLNIVGGAATKLPPNPFRRTGFVFVGWNSSQDGTGAVHSDDQGFVTLNSSLTLYAQWAQARSVNYDLNGGSGTGPGATTVGEGIRFTVAALPDSATAPSGQGFLGWTNNRSTTGPSISAAVQGVAGATSSGTIVMPNADLTLYAVWVPMEWFNTTHRVYATYLGSFLSVPAVVADANRLELINVNDKTFVPDATVSTNSAFVPIPPGITAVSGDQYTASANVLQCPSSVTEIGDYTFAFFFGDSLSLPAYLTSISPKAFYEATIGSNSVTPRHLANLYLTSELPPTVGGDGLFPMVNITTQDFHIHVPSPQSLDAYQKAPGWQAYSSFLTSP